MLIDHSQKNQPESKQEPSPNPYEWATALIGWVLQGGVLLSAIIILISIILLPTRPGGLSAQRLLVFPFTLSQLLSELAQFRPQSIITLGLLCLIATPAGCRLYCNVLYCNVRGGT